MAAARLVLWIILLSPFALVAYGYESLEDPLPLIRSLSGDVALWGRKSLLTAFRLPLIAAMMGLAIETMRLHTAGSPDARTRSLFGKLWNILLATLAAKTLIQAIEVVWPASDASPRTSVLFFGLTLLVVFSGLAAAAAIGRTIYSEKRFKLDPLSNRTKAVLALLAIGYAVAAFLPLLISRVGAPQ